jgi:hypothetical protein
LAGSGLPPHADILETIEDGVVDIAASMRDPDIDDSILGGRSQMSITGFRARAGDHGSVERRISRRGTAAR